jgi:hypothetical protein
MFLLPDIAKNSGLVFGAFLLIGTLSSLFVYEIE